MQIPLFLSFLGLSSNTSTPNTDTFASHTMAGAASKTLLNPATFPRPPAVERVSRLLEVKWNNATVARTNEAYWVLETYHPPTYYLPRASIQAPFTELLVASSSGSSWCEWKGRAKYWDLSLPKGDGEGEVSGAAADGEKIVVKNRIWSYPDPTPGFVPIKDYLSFYAGPWQCFVDGEEVKAQPGDFYGGWTTSDIDTTHVKGAPGTRHW